MNTNEEIKALKLRITLLEFQTNKTEQLFIDQIQIIQARNNYTSPQCPQCFIDISQKEPGSCQNESCACGLN